MKNKNALVKSLLGFLVIIVAVVLLVNLFTPKSGVEAPTATQTPTEAPTTPAEAPSVSAPTTTPTTPEKGAEGVTSVVEALNSLAVEEENAGVSAGYDRDYFKHWITQPSGCDTRAVVLNEEARELTKQGCEPVGTWVSVYDNVTTTDPGTFDIDHMVPLKEAWESGAHTWDAQTREDYANDLGYEHSLIAVTLGTNRSKGDKDPADWLPDYNQCFYANAWVAVKVRWNLTVDQAEKSVLTNVLADCSDEEMSFPKVNIAPTEKAAPVESSAPVEPQQNGTDTRFASCQEANANGVGPYVKGVDPEYDWYSDRDKDGTVCE